MKNFKINMNQKPLSGDELTPKRDFNQLLKTYNTMKTPFFKTSGFWFGTTAALVATIAAVVIYNKAADFGSDNIPAPFINPPIVQADIKTDSYVINAETDSTITHNTGSKIHIPANAFLDENGNPVTGEVELKYREFHSSADIFLAGIPMTYDSAGEQYHFETAGMMEIAALQNGKPLITNPAALITVDMVSENSEDKFNTYYLDTLEKKWKYLAQKNYDATEVKPVTPVTEYGDTSASPAANDMLNYRAYDKPSQQVYDKLASTKTEIATLKQQMPVEPKKIDKGKPRFSIKVDEKEFPEIAVYSNIKFQANDKTYNAEKASIVWENIELKRLDEGMNYEISFINSKERYTVVASPVFDDKDYSEARKTYEEKFADYQAKLEQKKAEEVKLKADLEARAKAVEEQIKKEVELQQQRAKEYEARLTQSNLVFRTFQVERFGMWNCDCPSNLPRGANVVARLVDSKTKDALKVQNVYLVEKGRNAIFTYYPDRMNDFRFDPGKKNIVWAVTNDLRIAVMSAEDFRAAQKISGVMNLELEVIDKKFASSAEVKAYLEI